MICPKCNSEIPDDENECPECHYDTKENVKKTRRKGNLRKKILFVLVIVLAVSIAGFSVYAGLNENKGYRKSQKLSKKIGENSEKAYSYAKTECVSSSAYDSLNELTDFNVLCESEKSIEVYGVKLPAWAIFCSEDSFGKLECVTYCDFKVLKNNINGIRKSSRIDISQIKTGMKSAGVDEILDMKPYQTVYSKNSISKKYKYYFKQNDGVKAYYITVIFSPDTNTVNSPVIEEKNDFIYEILKSEKH